MKNIIYLDYSATTKVDEKVLKRFSYIASNLYGNPNSSHSLGIQVKKVIEDATKNIGDYLGIDYKEIIFTSGATEANNLAIKGISESNRKQIITTELEHSSIFGPIGYLQKLGKRVDFVKLNKNGTVDLNHLESLLSEDTLLVSVGAVDSELGIRQPIEEIGLLLKKHPGIIFHSDITQAIGKTNLDLTNLDLASFSGHKIYSFKGIGGLIKKSHLKINPLIHGGKSTTIYRSGTPATELVGALSESFNLFKDSLEEKYDDVKKINNKLKEELIKYENVVINSNDKSIPHILNLSIIGSKPDEVQKYFASNNIFISTKTACASDNKLSKTVLAITNDEARAASSIRISLSYKTTEQELKRFIQIFNKYMEEEHEIN